MSDNNEPQPPQICDTCKQPFRSIEYDVYCSAFCFELPKALREEFKTMKPGEYGLWPCAEGGCIIEDVYVPNGVCVGCAPKRQVKELKLENERLRAALREACDLATPFTVERAVPPYIAELRPMFTKLAGISVDERVAQLRTVAVDEAEALKFK